MLDQKRRWIYYYQFFLKPYPEDAPYTKMKYILDMISDLVEAGECVKLIENKTAAIRIKDMVIDNKRDVAVLLFQYSDTKVSDPAFANLETGDLRVEPKLEGEGVAVSSHIVISLSPIKPLGNTYLCLLEDVPGIGKTKIEPFLTSTFREVFDNRYPNYKGKSRKYWPTSELTGCVSESLKEGLEKGFLKGFELKKYVDVDGELDEEGYVKVENHTVKLKTSKRFKSDEAVGVINRVKAKAKALDFQEMVVKYERKEGKSKSVPVSTAREDAGDALFAKFEVVNLANPLPQCVPEIRDELMGKIIELLIAAR